MTRDGVIVDTGVKLHKSAWPFISASLNFPSGANNLNP
jgi:hypothetical protein